jgi:hypothetical protein
MSMISDQLRHCVFDLGVGQIQYQSSSNDGLCIDEIWFISTRYARNYCQPRCLVLCLRAGGVKLKTYVKHRGDSELIS